MKRLPWISPTLAAVCTFALAVTMTVTACTVEDQQPPAGYEIDEPGFELDDYICEWDDHPLEPECIHRETGEMYHPHVRTGPYTNPRPAKPAKPAPAKPYVRPPTEAQRDRPYKPAPAMKPPAYKPPTRVR